MTRGEGGCHGVLPYQSGNLHLTGRQLNDKQYMATYNPLPVQTSTLKKPVASNTSQ